MSNGTEAAPAGLVAAQIVFLMGWATVAAWLMRRRGLLRVDVVLGPVRMLPGENPWIWGGIALVAVSTGLIAGQVALAAWEVSEAWAPYVHGVVLSLVGIAAVVAGVKGLLVGGWGRIGLGGQRLGRTVVAAVVTLLAVLPVVYLMGIVAMAAAKMMGRPPQPHRLLTDLQASRDLLPLVVAMAVVLAPLLEELVFRGLIQTFLTRLLTGPAEAELTPGLRTQGRWQSILITSLLFAAIHGEPAFLPPLFVLSVGLGVAYERTGNLWVPIIIHSLFNSGQVALFLLMLNGVA